MPNVQEILRSYVRIAGIPGGLVGCPRAYQDPFRAFGSHRVHAPGDFFLHKN